MEEKILNSLKLDITFPILYSFFFIIYKKFVLGKKIFYLSLFIMELFIIDYKILKF